MSEVVTDEVIISKLEYLLKIHNICPECGAKMQHSKQTLKCGYGTGDYWECECGNKYWLKKGATWK